MKIHAGDALKSPGTPFDFEFEQPWHAIDFAGDHIIMAEPVKIKGVFLGQSDSVLVQGGLQTVSRMECSRCLTNFDRPLEPKFCEEFYQGPSRDDRDGYPFEGDWIDLTEMVDANIVLNLPVKKLCRQDCPGLCQVCGKDLSLGSCGCAVPAENDDFYRDLLKLKALLQDDKEV
jgi:uncharacterized protein